MIKHIKKIVILMGIVIGMVILLTPNKGNVVEINTNVSKDKNLESIKVIKEEEKIALFLEEKMDSIIFLANTFKIDKEIIIELLKENKMELNYLENSANFDKILIDYLFTLEDSNKKLFDTKREPCTMDKEYIIKLIKYFSSIYDQVDFSIAAGIAEVESGFTSKYMLSRNNIFGGLVKGKLLSYRNIEYGVLSYIKLLNDGYFTKGLTTVETIGKIYNPVFNENGEKIARPTWVVNVNKAKENYLEIDEVDTSLLNSLKNSRESLAK